MIKDYLIVAYLTAIVAWPFTLVLIGLFCWSCTLYEAQSAVRCPRRSVHAGGHRCVAV
jgi:hypothetical protein